MYRLAFASTVILWVAAMSALFFKDIWPAWVAQDPPPMSPEQFLTMLQEEQQFELIDEQGRQIGTAWSSWSPVGDRTVIYGTIRLSLPQIPYQLRVETVTEFDTEGELDTFDLRVHGVPSIRIHLHGERHGMDFPVEIHLGPIHRGIKLNLASSRLIGDSFRPFSFLPDLEVGQAWRMQILNPLSAALSANAEFTSIVARVTGKAMIEHPLHPGTEVECFVVETTPQETRAWVQQDGRVLQQEAELPGLGKIRVTLEPYSENERRSARSEIGGTYRREPVKVPSD